MGGNETHQANQKPKLLEQLQLACLRRHYSTRTIKNYAHLAQLLA
jgi:hypothetical protein